MMAAEALGGKLLGEVETGSLEEVCGISLYSSGFDDFDVYVRSLSIA